MSKLTSNVYSVNVKRPTKATIVGAKSASHACQGRRWGTAASHNATLDSTNDAAVFGIIATYPGRIDFNVPIFSIQPKITRKPIRPTRGTTILMKMAPGQDTSKGDLAATMTDRKRFQCAWADGTHAFGIIPQ